MSRFEITVEGDLRDLLVVDHVHPSGRCLVFATTLEVSAKEIAAATDAHDAECRA